MKSLYLINPSKEMFNQYKEMMDEWNMEGSRISPWPLQLKYHTEELYNDMLKRVSDVEKGINLGEFASSSTYWLYDEENDNDPIKVITLKKVSSKERKGSNVVARNVTGRYVYDNRKAFEFEVQ